DTYEQLGIPYIYPGHPLCQLARPKLSDADFHRLIGRELSQLDHSLIVGVMPGSRRGEIADIAPEVFRAVALLQQACREAEDLPEIIAVAPVAHEELRDAMLAAARRAGLDELVMIEGEYRYDLMARSALMIV